MLLRSSLIISILLLMISVSLSQPTHDRCLRNRNRPKRKSSKTGKSKVEPEGTDCIKGFCSNVTSYPIDEVNSLLKENAFAGFYLKQFENPVPKITLQQEHLCEIIARTLSPRRGTTVLGAKEFIVQTETAKQSIYLEVCQNEEPKLIDRLGCLPDGYNMFCEQQYRIIPLVVYDEKVKTLKSNQFKVPSGCSAQLTQTHKL